MLAAGAAHQTSAGRIALPNGSRFQLQLESTHAGNLEVHTQRPGPTHASDTDPNAPLWEKAVTSGEQIESPTLRLDGKRGLETLYVVLRGENAQVLAQGKVEIWHL